MMKKIFLITILLLFTASIYAEGNAGTEDIFNFGAGAKALALGRTFVALSDDVSAIYWNPAGLFNLNKKTVSIFYSKLFYDTFYGFLGYVHPTADYGTLGIAVLSLYTGGISAYDNDSFYINDFSNTKMKILVGYANKLPWIPLVLGLNFKMNISSLNNESATAINMDIGLQYNLLKPDLKAIALSGHKSIDDEFVLGLVFKNIFFKTGTRLNLEEDEENFEIKIGGTYLHWMSQGFSIRGLLDLHFHEQRSMQFSLGLESRIYDKYFIRTGYILDSGLSFGAGILYSQWQLDYALTFRPLGATHNMSITWEFGQSRLEIYKEREDIILARIRKNVEEERKKQIDFYDNKIKKMRENIETANKKMRQTLKVLKEQGINRLTKLVESYKVRLKNLSKTSKKERGDLTRKFELEKRLLKRDEEQKVNDYSKAIEFFNRSQYRKALVLFNKVRRRDPRYAEVIKYIRKIQAQKRDVTSYSKQVLNYYKIGVRLYLTGKYLKAIAMWQRILRIDPYNKLALRNIERARRRLGYKTKR